MNIKDNYSITKLFISKEIKIYIDNDVILFKAPTVRNLYEDDELMAAHALLIKSLADWEKESNVKFDSVLKYISLLIFELGKFKQYSVLVDRLRNGFVKILPQVEFDFKNKLIKVNNITMTDEICDYVIYLLKLCCGEKITQPLTFSSPEARAFFLQQQKYEEEIQRVKGKDGGDKEGLIKSFLLITYKFPSLTFEYLFEQTLAQIHWLSKTANGAVSYSFKEKVFAAGNVKKGEKLDFFIK